MVSQIIQRYRWVQIDGYEVMDEILGIGGLSDCVVKVRDKHDRNKYFAMEVYTAENLQSQQHSYPCFEIEK